MRITKSRKIRCARNVACIKEKRIEYDVLYENQAEKNDRSVDEERVLTWM
jgi:hypothetical protein